MIARFPWLWLWLWLWLLSPVCQAHKSSDAFLYLDTTTSLGRYDISLTDMDRIIPGGLDQDRNGEITWMETRARLDDLNRYLDARLRIESQGQACALSWQTPGLTQHSDGYHVANPFAVDCHNQVMDRVDYHVLFDMDSMHRGLIQIQSETEERLTALSPDSTSLPLQDEGSLLDTVSAFFHQGVWHLWMGYDHLLFLLALLLPAVLRRQSGQWVPALSAQAVVREVLTLVTLFTLAHSVTLSLATLEIVRPSTVAIEVLIALSISFAGLQVLFPINRGRSGILAFSFGLIHGFGFANALSELGVTLMHKAWALAAFNLGVETGQIVVVALTLPQLFLWRRNPTYQRWLTPGSAWCIVVVGLYWTLERSLF